jgi:hypothetical protein
VSAMIRAALLVGAVLVALPSCKPKVTPAQCDTLVDRYAQLVVTEKLPDAGPATIKSEQERERGEARGDDAFKNCTSEVSRAEFDCAMRAPTADALEKCLE